MNKFAKQIQQWLKQKSFILKNNISNYLRNNCALFEIFLKHRKGTEIW